MINTLVTDLSHWDPAYDYIAAKANGLVGVIYKATQGALYFDHTYEEQRKLATTAGLLWGAYHFGDSSDPEMQVNHFLEIAALNPEDLFALDFEGNAGSTMGLNQAYSFINLVESKLGRDKQCVLYSGNLIKETLASTDERRGFFGARRLWLAQYGNQPILPRAWSAYWLWQFTDGHVGPHPHSLPGLYHSGVDMNSFAGTPAQLKAQWANGKLINATTDPNPSNPVNPPC